MHLYGGIAKPASAGILVLFCLYLGLYHALFGALITLFRRGRPAAKGALLLSPFAWVAVELARARITGLPWDLIGIAQVDNPLLTQLAPITGAYGLSFVIAGVNAMWLTRIVIKQRRYARPALALSCATFLVLYIVVLRRVHPPTFERTQATAALLQENLEVGEEAASAGPPLTIGEELKSFSELSLLPQAGEVCVGIPELPETKCTNSVPSQQRADVDGTRNLQGTDLIVWPEAPNDFKVIDPALRATSSSREFQTAMASLARAANAPIIVGDIAFDADPAVERGYDEYNSASFVAPDGRFVGRYDKMHLVPFGEYTPYKRLFFFAGSLLQDVGLLDFGRRRTVFKTRGHTYGTFICYESVFADEIRQFADLDADVLVNISDDGWYGDTSAAWEHLNMVRMRAIENHRWILRAANTGVTAAIDPYGRVVAAAPRHIRTSIRVGFNYEQKVTFYAAHGDLFAYFCSLVVVVAFGLSSLRRATPVTE